MASTPRRDLGPGDLAYIPQTEPERRQHVDALLQRADRDPDRRADLLIEAAEVHVMLEEHQQAELLFTQALADGAVAAGSVHARFAWYLFDQGRDTEALELINQARKLRPDDPKVFSIIGSALLDSGRPAEAAKWFTSGLVRTFGGLADIKVADLRGDPNVIMLIRGRLDARETLGLEPDHLDDLYANYIWERRAR